MPVADLTQVQIQTAATKGWSVESVPLDGWILRAAGGYSQRANSVLAAGPLERDLQDAIAAAEDWYAKRDLQPCFQVFEGVHPVELLEALVSRGYQEVEGYDLPAQVFVAANPEAVADPDVQLAPHPPEDWASEWLQMCGDPVSYSRLVNDILVASPAASKAFATLMVDEEPAAVAYGAITDGMLGVFCVDTDPAFRRRGLARRVIGSLHSWGKEHRADGAYLQMWRDNSAARPLYEGMGYTLLDDYTYFRR